MHPIAVLQRSVFSVLCVSMSIWIEYCRQRYTNVFCFDILDLAKNSTLRVIRLEKKTEAICLYKDKITKANSLFKDSKAISIAKIHPKSNLPWRHSQQLKIQLTEYEHQLAGLGLQAQRQPGPTPPTPHPHLHNSYTRLTHKGR